MKRFVFVLVAGLLAGSSAAAAAELRVLSGNGARAAVQELCSQFERSTGDKIDLRFGVNVDVKKRSKPASASMSSLAIRRSSTP